MGARLVERTTRRLAPTQAGLRLAVRARQLIVDYAEATARVKRSRDAPLQGLLSDDCTDSVRPLARNSTCGEFS
jgi:DNA-binding transcriptional LysR family regulator